MPKTPFTFPQRLKRIFLNKYVLVLSLFVVELGFFDEHNLISRIETNLKNTDLEKENDFYRKEIQENKHKIDELQSNNENLEKFAREKYLMKKDNEDIFIIKE